ncbi:MAG: type II toxin-antitoxin system CcdA family antitoxin [Sulfitobacter sp.]|uniref:type II toxin-antitoxin system CcdA family antitoxin n=1 Tax=Sulfitobacter sp. TaxID=1903071 RepID=UPI00405A0ECA
MPRVKVNLTLEADLVEAARGLGLNMSRIAETAIAKTVKAERNRLWREENREAMQSYAEEMARDLSKAGPHDNDEG